jgi:NAD(P)-dependent dehydrogenase (short-subunit alcohol dehydrogenase family)
MCQGTSCVLSTPSNLTLLRASQALLQRNANVYLACRNQSSAEAAITELRESTGKEAIFLQLDLADLQSVRRAAEDFTRSVYSPRQAVNL